MAFFVTNASFVFIVEVSDPSRFTSNRLVQLEVFPADAQFLSNLTLPYISQIGLVNGFSFAASEERITLARDSNLSADAAAQQNSVSDLMITNELALSALKLVPELAPLRLQSIGTNFRIFIPNADLSRFIVNLPVDSLPLEFKFYDTYADVQTNYTLTAVVSAEQATLSGVLIDVNFNGQLAPEDTVSNEARAERIYSLIQRQQEFFESTKGTVDALNF